MLFIKHCNAVMQSLQSLVQFLLSESWILWQMFWILQSLYKPSICMLIRYSVRFYLFFFSSRRRHTRLQGDWSSDVCSSDLSERRAGRRQLQARMRRDRAACGRNFFTRKSAGCRTENETEKVMNAVQRSYRMKIGRASCRERV